MSSTELPTVKLNDAQSAEPGQCGSCHFYRSREPGDSLGVCNFTFPPQVAKAVYEGAGDSWCNNRTVKDTYSCNLYRAAQVTYVQEKKWRAGTPTPFSK